MNKTLLLLLVTLIQNQSNGVVLSESNANQFDQNFHGFPLEDSGGSAESIPHSNPGNEYNGKSISKRSGGDVLMRRSILDKNFMRFGRTSEPPCSSKNCQSIQSISEYDDGHFMRDTRGMRDNFIRFGRGAMDNFIRFGRKAMDNFIRFGRDESGHHLGGLDPDEFTRAIKSLRDSGFIRFGRRDRDNFIRFGKLDQNFIRFGRGPDKIHGYYEEISPGVAGDSSEDNRKDDGEEERRGSDEIRSDFGEADNKETNSDFAVRKKRETSGANLSDSRAKGAETEKTENQRGENLKGEKFGVKTKAAEKVLNRRSAGFFRRIPGFFPQDFPPRIQYVKPWEDMEGQRIYYSGANPPFFPLATNY